MNYITTTDLRTKSVELVNSLRKGEPVTLIHRSKIVGVIKPVKEEPQPLTGLDAKKLQQLATKLNLHKFSYKEREKRYRKHLMEKYGQDLS